MTRLRFFTFSGSCLLLVLPWRVLAAPSAPHPSPPHYAIVDLGTLGGKTISVSGINNRGEVVGQAQTSRGKSHAFRWSHHRMRDLGTLGGDESGAGGINDRGQVVGIADLPRKDKYNNFISRSVIWQDGRMRVLGSFSGDAINNKGQVAGVLSFGWAASFLRLWSHGRVRRLGELNDDGNWVAAMNDSGDMVVNGQTSGGEHTFILHQGRRIRISLPYPGDCQFNAINNRGQAVGHLCGAVVIWQDGKETVLPQPANQFDCQPCGINDRGVVVGTDNSDVPHALLWFHHQVYDLTRLILKNSGWKLGEANAINERGQIAGTGIYHGNMRAFLLTPTARQ